MFKSLLVFFVLLSAPAGAGVAPDCGMGHEWQFIHRPYPVRLAAVRKPVVDGDTIKVDADLGFGITKRLTVRLFGINAPETRGPERAQGLAAREALRSMLPESGWFSIVWVDQKSGKYGRPIVILCHNGNINEAMVASGHAKRAEY